MQTELLPDPEDLWWSWVVLAAVHAAEGEQRVSLDPREHVLRLDLEDGSWLRLQRFRGGRATLWGRANHDSTPPSEPPLAEAPEWANSDALDKDAAELGFLAWWRRGEWDTSTETDDRGPVQLLQTVLATDPHAVTLVRQRKSAEFVERFAPEGDTDAVLGVLDRAYTRAEPGDQASISALLISQIHEQMRVTREFDRLLSPRPPVLVQWSRVHGLRLPMEYAVRVEQGRFITGAGFGRLPEPATASLDNVLRRLHAEEASQESGAWLFARVRYDGRAIRFDRAFDSWPGWFGATRDQGPGMTALHWEMQQRSAQWRPAWASLLRPPAAPSPRSR